MAEKTLSVKTNDNNIVLNNVTIENIDGSTNVLAYDSSNNLINVIGNGNAKVCLDLLYKKDSFSQNITKYFNVTSTSPISGNTIDTFNIVYPGESTLLYIELSSVSGTQTLVIDDPTTTQNTLLTQLNTGNYKYVYISKLNNSLNIDSLNYDIEVYSGGTNSTEVSFSKKNIKNMYGGNYTRNKGTITNMYGGNITWNEGYKYYDTYGHVINMYGGKIINNNYEVVNMYGGTIINNGDDISYTSNERGWITNMHSGTVNQNRSTITNMYNGTVKLNNTTGIITHMYGGSVETNNGTMTVG